MNWIKGRQQGGYELLTIINNKACPFDLHIVRYKEGNFISAHTDPVSSKKHYRLNIIIKPAAQGGEFVCKDCIVNTKYVKVFRPDINKHSVTKVIKGTRYILSIGWARK